MRAELLPHSSRVGVWRRCSFRHSLGSSAGVSDADHDAGVGVDKDVGFTTDAWWQI
jgi:hypothetical protein